MKKHWPNAEKMPLDGGWGWMVVLGCTLMSFLVGGINRSYGVIFVQLRRRFNSSASITAGVGGATQGFSMVLSRYLTSITPKEILKLKPL